MAGQLLNITESAAEFWKTWDRDLSCVLALHLPEKAAKVEALSGALDGYADGPASGGCADSPVPVPSENPLRARRIPLLELTVSSWEKT